MFKSSIEKGLYHEIDLWNPKLLLKIAFIWKTFQTLRFVQFKSNLSFYVLTHPKAFDSEICDVTLKGPCKEKTTGGNCWYKSETWVKSGYFDYVHFDTNFKVCKGTGN